MSDQPKVSERMFNLVTDFGADCVNHGCNQLRPMVGYPLIENVQHRAKELALYSAIAELEQRAETQHKRAEKWKEAAVAFERWRHAHSETPASRDVFDALCDRLDAAIAALGDEWDEAVR